MEFRGVMVMNCAEAAGGPDLAAREPFRLSNQMTLGIVTAAVYLPCTLGFFMDQSGDVASWVTLWPFVPGGFYVVLAGNLVPVGSVPPIVAYGLCLVLTAALIGGLWLVGRRGPGWLAASAVVGSVLSTISVVAAISAVRM
jgi:hypothetical protein